MSLLRAFRQKPNTGEIDQHEHYSTLLATRARQHGDNYQRPLNSALIPPPPSILNSAMAP
jgi:hypothetical protein